MAHKDKYANLVKIKTALAEKYEHLANITGSKVKRKTYQFRATNYRRQAAEFSKVSGGT